MTSAVSRIAKAVARLAWPVLVAQLAVIASGVPRHRDGGPLTARWTSLRSGSGQACISASSSV